MLLPRQPPFRKRRESKSEKRVTSLYLINMLPLFREKHVYFSNARSMTLFPFRKGGFILVATTAHIHTASCRKDVGSV